MTKPTPRTKPIDLIKCKVGQRVKLRNGDIAQLSTVDGDANFPYCCINIKNAQAVTYTKNGRFMQSAREYPLDIVALLPLPKKAGKKASGMPAEKPLKMTKRERELHNGQIKNVIKLLKGLLKP